MRPTSAISIVQRLDDAQPPAGRVERAAGHAHPPPAPAARARGGPRSPPRAAPPGRRRAGGSPAPGAAERAAGSRPASSVACRRSDLARQLGGQPLGRRCGLGQPDLGRGRLLAFAPRRRERLARGVAARQLGLSLSQIVAHGRERRLRLAQLGVAHLELVAPRRELRRAPAPRTPRALVGAQALVLDAHAVELVQIPLELVMPGFEIAQSPARAPGAPRRPPCSGRAAARAL